MGTIETKADMMREFHITMGATCEHCKYSQHCNGTLVWCEKNRAGISKYKNSYCQDWEAK